VRLTGKLALLRGLLTAEKAYIGPAVVVFDLTRRCNNICLGCFSHCIQGREPSPGDHTIQDVPLEFAREISSELARLGTSEVVLLGEGEPLLHPRYFDIVSIFTRAGFKTRTFTNGILVDEIAAQRLVETAQNTIHVTFWAVNEKEHEEWHPGISIAALQRRRRGLELIARAKERAPSSLPKVSLIFPLHRANYTNIEERVRLSLSSGCQDVQFQFFRDWGGRYEKYSLLPQDLEQIRQPLLEAGKRLESANISHNIGSYLARLKHGAEILLRAPCYVGWYHSSIKVDGSVLPCAHCSLVLGNARETPFSEIWNSAAYRDFRKRSANPEALLSFGNKCDCMNCCNWIENRRVHSLFRFFSFAGRRRGGAGQSGYASSGSRRAWVSPVSNHG
jgi:radical SAM protein with 4Fe4S-binding SPASM domain